MSASYPLIPYGWADFRAIRLEGRLYVDKTRFIRPLEDERFTFLICPRRFGKSCWVSMLENYYDRYWADEFKQVFGGTEIGRKPTEKRHSYMVLRFDFSTVNDASGTFCLSVSHQFLLRTETELSKSFADIFLQPMMAHYSELHHGCLIEVKYLKRGEDAGDVKVQMVIREAEEQLRRYLADERLKQQYPSTRFTELVVVFQSR